MRRANRGKYGRHVHRGGASRRGAATLQIDRARSISRRREIQSAMALKVLELYELFAAPINQAFLAEASREQHDVSDIDGKSSSWYLYPKGDHRR